MLQIGELASLCPAKWSELTQIKDGPASNIFGGTISRTPQPNLLQRLCAYGLRVPRRRRSDFCARAIARLKVQAVGNDSDVDRAREVDRGPRTLFSENR